MNPEQDTLNSAKGADIGTKMAPGGLSEWGEDVYATLVALHAPAPHEMVTLLRALKWWCLSDELLDEATLLAGRERAAKLKAAGDASTSALRHWRCLRFPADLVDDDLPPKVGRPSGPGWHAVGKAAQQQRQRAWAEKRRNGEGDPRGLDAKGEKAP